MTFQEPTHTYQHLAAQAALEKQWASRVEGALTDHAQWLDHHIAAGNSVAARLDALATAKANLTTTTITTADDGATAAAPALAFDGTDAALRAHVQAQDVAMGARLAAAEAGLRDSIAALDVGLRRHA